MNLPFKLGIDADGNYGYIKDGADAVIPFKKVSYKDRIVRIYGKQSWKPDICFDGSATVRTIPQYWSYGWSFSGNTAFNTACTLTDYEHGGTTTGITVEQDEFVQIETSITVSSGNGGTHTITATVYRNGASIGNCSCWCNGFEGKSGTDKKIIAVKKRDVIKLVRTNYNAGTCNYSASCNIRFCEDNTGWKLPQGIV